MQPCISGSMSCLTLAASVFALALICGNVAGQSCVVANASKVNCGFVGIDQQECVGLHCCWSPEGQNSAIPWCYEPVSSPAPAGAPFNASELAVMTKYFLANLNVDLKGGVAASPDVAIGYYFHWMRDAALAMKTLQLVSADFSSVVPLMESYVQWVLGVQSQPDPHGIDVRTEPKFDLPNGTVYAGGWCRPQTDGPGLRATTLTLFATQLMAASTEGRAYVSQFLYTGPGGPLNGGAIKFDLDWVDANWAQNGCDAWEEVQSADFFWNRMVFTYALSLGSELAAQMGDTASSQRYAASAAAVNATLAAHWNGEYVYEATIRPIDSLVVLAFNNAQEATGAMFAPTSEYVAATMAAFVTAMAPLYPINQQDTDAGVPGVLVGRYPGDTFMGGNPWILCSAAFAEQCYHGALALARGEPVSERAAQHFAKLMGISAPLARRADGALDTLVLASQLSDFADGILDRIHYHVAPAGLHLSEQLDKDTGFETSATDLTWSYGVVFKAMYYRDAAIAAIRRAVLQ